MKTRMLRGFPRIVLMLCLCGGASAPMLWAQQARYTYHDKLFGKTHTFTPKPDEVMVRFHPSSQVGAAAQGVRTRFGLVPVHEEGLERHRFGVYRVPVGATAEALRPASRPTPPWPKPIRP